MHTIAEAVEELIKITSMYHLQAGKTAKFVGYILLGDKRKAKDLWITMGDVRTHLYDVFNSDIDDWINS